MATARCYTKSGSVEKYEPGLFSGSVNHGPHSFITELIGPDSNGNYTITYNGYDDGTSDNYDCYCKTIYGPDWRNNKGEINTFYFKKKIQIISLSSNIQFSGVGMNVYLYFSNNEYLGNDTLTVSVKVTCTNPQEYIDLLVFIVSKNSKSPLKEIIERKNDPMRRYRAEIKSCSPMSGDNYQVIYNHI